MEQPGILVANDLSPSETVQLPKDKILAFVTKQGSTNSHTAILARIMNIPSLVQAEIDLTESIHGQQMIVDGFEGVYYLQPEPEGFCKKCNKSKHKPASTNKCWSNIEARLPSQKKGKK